jgi:hypothetical protein
MSEVVQWLWLPPLVILNQSADWCENPFSPFDIYKLVCSAYKKNTDYHVASLLVMTVVVETFCFKPTAQIVVLRESILSQR